MILKTAVERFDDQYLFDMQMEKGKFLTHSLSELRVAARLLG